MKTKPNELVSAYGYANEQSHFDSQGGLTKREYFAAMAMQGFITIGYTNPDVCVSESVEIADALIERLNK